MSGKLLITEKNIYLYIYTFIFCGTSTQDHRGLATYPSELEGQGGGHLGQGAN